MPKSESQVHRQDVGRVTQISTYDPDEPNVWLSGRASIEDFEAALGEIELVNLLKAIPEYTATAIEQSSYRTSIQTSRGGKKYFGVWVNDKERAFLRKHPGSAVTGALIGFGAFMRAKGFPGRTDGKQDAMRHCMWSAYLTAILGKAMAKKILANHEWNPKGERNLMDEHNNAQGIRIGQKTKVSDIYSQCVKALESGKLDYKGKKKPKPKPNSKPRSRSDRHDGGSSNAGSRARPIESPKEPREKPDPPARSEPPDKPGNDGGNQGDGDPNPNIFA